jgi:hypothetical protein
VAVPGGSTGAPVRGLWPDELWKGRWGDTPPYHVPVSVLTHHARVPLAKVAEQVGTPGAMHVVLRRE